MWSVQKEGIISSTQWVADNGQNCEGKDPLGCRTSRPIGTLSGSSARAVGRREVGEEAQIQHILCKGAA